MHYETNRFPATWEISSTP